VAEIRPAARSRAVLALMVASGFAGLGYQIVWTQQASLWLGHEAAAVLAVITAFFGGLALGALTLGRRIDRSPKPARWYAGCEVLIGAWSLVLALAMAPISNALLGLIGAEPSPLWHGAVAFVGCFLLLLPATVAMGATLPAMERVLAGLAAARSPVAALYASNTLGAVVGVLATAFWLVPTFGLSRTAAACAGLNLLCAVLALRLAPREPDVVQPAQAPAMPLRESDTRVSSGLLVLAATGFLGIGYEVLVVRVLSQVTENTVYTFAILLAIYLAGTALGAAIYGRFAPARAGAAWRDGLLTVVAASCLAGTASLWSAEWLRDAALAWRAAEGTGGLGGALAGEALPALLAFALPTVAMGALFSHLATQTRESGVSLGHALGVNTLGAAAAPPLVAWGLVPVLGSRGALLAVVVGYLLLVRRTAWPRAGVVGAAAATAAMAVLAPPLAFIDVPEGGQVLSYREGALAAVSVVADADGVARLRINNRQQEGSSATLLADARQALLPLLLHPAPRRALFLGLGTGVTASAAAADPALQVDAAELLPEVIEASALFRTGGTASPRLVATDARRFVKAGTARYDVIVSDNFHPARSGSALLYTEEHFRAVRARLAPGGLFCQWMPLHQIDIETLRSVVQSFLAVFPEGAAVLATNSLQTPVLGLVAREDAARFSVAAVQARLASYGGPQRLPDFGLADTYAVLGSLIADPAALRRFAGDAPSNTDDRPVVAYRAPRITYAPDSAPADRLQALLAELSARSVDPARLIDPGTEPAWLPRLAAYWAARDAFIAAGRAVRPSADARQMLAQVQAPLLAVLKTSPDFRPAFEPLQRMAQQLQHSDPAEAQALLEALAAVDALRFPAAPSAQAPQP
jgi:spermidine synthase